MALTGLAVALGTADKAQADDRHGIPEGQCAWICEADPGSICQLEPETKWRKFYYCHTDEGCFNSTPGTPPCVCTT